VDVKHQKTIELLYQNQLQSEKMGSSCQMKVWLPFLIRDNILWRSDCRGSN